MNHSFEQSSAADKVAEDLMTRANMFRAMHEETTRTVFNTKRAGMTRVFEAILGEPIDTKKDASYYGDKLDEPWKSLFLREQFSSTTMPLVRGNTIAEAVASEKKCLEQAMDLLSDTEKALRVESAKR